MVRVKTSQQKSRKQRKQQRFKFFFTLTLVVAFLVGIYFFMNARFVQYKDVKIEGLWLINKAEIDADLKSYLNEKVLYFIPKSNIFIFNEKKFEEYLFDNYARIEDLSISLDTFINVDISERKIFSLWCTAKEELDTNYIDEECLSLNQKGYAFAEAPYFSNGLFLKIFTSEKKPELSQFIEEDDFREMNRFLTYLESEFNFDIEKIVIRDFRDADIFVSRLNNFYYPEEQLKIRFNFHESYESQIESMLAVINHKQFKKDFSKKGQDLIYIDARFKNQVTYNFKQEKEENE